MKYRTLTPDYQINYLSDRLNDYEQNHFIASIEVDEFLLLGEGYEEHLESALKRVGHYKKLCRYLQKRLNGFKDTAE